MSKKKNMGAARRMEVFVKTAKYASHTLRKWVRKKRNMEKNNWKTNLFKLNKEYNNKKDKQTNKI